MTSNTPYKNTFLASSVSKKNDFIYKLFVYFYVTQFKAFRFASLQFIRIQVIKIRFSLHCKSIKFKIFIFMYRLRDGYI